MDNSSNADEDDDIDDRMDESERKAIASEEKIEGHLKKLFLRTEVLDRRADSVEEAFEKTLDRFDVKAKALNEPTRNLQHNAASRLGVVAVTTRTNDAKDTMSPLQQACPATRIVSEHSGTSHSVCGAQALGGATATMPMGLPVAYFRRRASSHSCERDAQTDITAPPGAIVGVRVVQLDEDGEERTPEALGQEIRPAAPTSPPDPLYDERKEDRGSAETAPAHQSAVGQALAFGEGTLVPKATPH